MVKLLVTDRSDRPPTGLGEAQRSRVSVRARRPSVLVEQPKVAPAERSCFRHVVVQWFRAAPRRPSTSREQGQGVVGLLRYDAPRLRPGGHPAQGL